MTDCVFLPGPRPGTVRSAAGQVLAVPADWELLPPGDVAAWAAGIEQDSSDPATVQAQALAGQADVQRRFSPRSNTASLLALAGLSSETSDS